MARGHGSWHRAKDVREHESLVTFGRTAAIRSTPANGNCKYFRLIRAF